MKKYSFIKLLVIILFTVVTGFKTQTNEQFNLKMNFTGIKTSDGNLLIAIYDSKKSFEEKKVTISIHKKVDNDNFSIEIFNLPKGEYAVMCFQDLNNNHQLDFNEYFMPTEPWGISNNKDLMRAPEWEDVKFELNKNLSININLF